DPVLERFDGGAAGPVLRVAREHAHPGAVRAAAPVQMTAHTPQPVADVRRQAFRRRHEQRATASDGHAERTVGNERVRRAAQRLRRAGARAIRTAGTGENDRGNQAQGGEGVHREPDSITLCRGSPIRSPPLQPFGSVTHPTSWRPPRPPTPGSRSKRPPPPPPPRTPPIPPPAAG